MRFLIGLAFMAFLAGCGQNKLETENADLKNQISKSELENSQIKIEVALLKQETNELGVKIAEETKLLQESRQADEEKLVTLTKLETENAGLKSAIDDLKQKNAAAEEVKVETIKQTPADNSKMINEDLENIIVHLERLQKEPKDFAKPAEEDRQAEADRLKQLANSEEASIQEIVNKLQGEGFTRKAELQTQLDDFDKHFNQSLYWWDMEMIRGYNTGFDDPTAKEYFSNVMKEDFGEQDDITKIKGFEIGSGTELLPDDLAAETQASKIVSLIKSGDMAGAKQIVDSIQDESLKELVKKDVEKALKQ